jgi:serine/threonine-protein kinase
VKLERRRGTSRSLPDLSVLFGVLQTRWARAGLIGLLGFGVGYLVAAIWLFPSPDQAEELDVVGVPNVTEVHFEDATERLESLGLEARALDRVADPTVPPNWVVAQSPLAHQLAAVGTPVYLTLSRGPEMQTVPDLSGLSTEDAEAVLAGLGFDVERRVVEGRSRGGVRGTRPAAGERLELPARVELEVVEGVQAAVVPDLLGRHIDDVAVLLEGAGLQLGTIRYDEAAPEAPGRVVGQFPPPGFSLKVGGLVSVEVAGAGEEPSTEEG